MMSGGFFLLGGELSYITLLVVSMLGMIPTLMILFLAPTLFVISEILAVQACKLSLIGGFKNILPFMAFNVGLMLIFILGVIALGVCILVSFPVAITAMYAAYHDIFD
ncbi:MAG: hypothetical protein ACI9FB_002218 [Candidatus Azotimanducaceae bacterium]|jgi:hypothetical protein